MTGGSWDSFSLSYSLSSGVGKQAIPLSGPTYVEQEVGLVGDLHRSIKNSNIRQQDMYGS